MNCSNPNPNPYTSLDQVAHKLATNASSQLLDLYNENRNTDRFTMEAPRPIEEYLPLDEELEIRWQTRRIS